MNLSGVREKIIRVPFVSQLPAQLRERMGMVLLWIGEIGDVASGDRLFNEGEHEGHYGILLLEGRAEVRRGENGERIAVSAPNLFGEMKQFMPEDERVATVEALDEGRILQFGWHDFVLACAQVFTKEEQTEIKDCIINAASERLMHLYESGD